MTGEEIHEPDHRIDVWRGDDGDWYWHKVDVGNGAIIADGGEGFTTREHAVTAAEDANPGVEVNVEE